MAVNFNVLLLECRNDVVEGGWRISLSHLISASIIRSTWALRVPSPRSSPSTIKYLFMREAKMCFVIGIYDDEVEWGEKSLLGCRRLFIEDFFSTLAGRLWLSTPLRPISQPLARWHQCVRNVFLIGPSWRRRQFHHSIFRFRGLKSENKFEMFLHSDDIFVTIFI